jgi:hypothetical protein
MWRYYLLLSVLAICVSAVLPNPCAMLGASNAWYELYDWEPPAFSQPIAAGDALALVFTVAVLVVGLGLYLVRPQGGHKWPPRCVPAISGERELNDRGRLAA